jgi:hypothetical protein
MWGRRKKRSTRLQKQLSLGLLEDAMTRAEQQADVPAEADAPTETMPYPGSVPPPAAPSERTGLLPADVPVDNSAGPPAADPAPPHQRQRPAARTESSTRHGSLG